jgi:phenylalanyl-tRNA synthetase beta chain
MPTIDIDYNEFESLLGIKLDHDLDKLDEILSFVKSEVKLFNRQEGILSVEIKDTNRPDLWSVEGLARGLRSYLKIERGPRNYVAENSIVSVNVGAGLTKIRPYICCSIIKDLRLTDTKIKGFMYLQEKLDQTYGRSRQKTSIGLYDFDLITPPLSYIAVAPDAFSFVPLGFNDKLTLSEILEKHPKGIEYGSIVKKNEKYPLLLDSQQKILSFPPIINSNDLGKVTEKTRNLLVEVTGTMYQTTANTLNLVSLALIDQGGKAYSATVNYPKTNFYKKTNDITPGFGNRTVNLDVDYAKKLLGLKLSPEKIADLLLTAGLGVEKIGDAFVEVIVPCYRVDVMHQVDLIEDVAISYGYNNIEPLWRDLPTTGSMRSEQSLLDVTRELMVGLGYQETLNYTLTNSETLFSKMNIEDQKVVELLNPKIVTMHCLRNWLLPSLMEFLSKNQSLEFPQKIFELGTVTLLDETTETLSRDEFWLSGVTTHPNAGFTEIKSVLASLFMNLGIKWTIKKVSHSSFITGRAGKIIVDRKEIGVLGEVNPQVLAAWKLENPAAAFEVNLNKILFSKS